MLTLLSVLSNDNYLCMISVLYNDTYVQINRWLYYLLPSVAESGTLIDGGVYYVTESVS